MFSAKPEKKKQLDWWQFAAGGSRGNPTGRIATRADRRALPIEAYFQSPKILGTPQLPNDKC